MADKTRDPPELPEVHYLDAFADAVAINVAPSRAFAEFPSDESAMYLGGDRRTASVRVDLDTGDVACLRGPVDYDDGKHAPITPEGVGLPHLPSAGDAYPWVCNVCRRIAYAPTRAAAAEEMAAYGACRPRRGGLEEAARAFWEMVKAAHPAWATRKAESA